MAACCLAIIVYTPDFHLTLVIKSTKGDGIAALAILKGHLSLCIVSLYLGDHVNVTG